MTTIDHKRGGMSML
jgi:hypothetical protein